MNNKQSGGLGGWHHEQISVSTWVQRVELMTKVTLEATPGVIKMHHRAIIKPQKEWLYQFVCLLFANAKPHLSLINYGGDGPVEAQSSGSVLRWQKRRVGSYLLVPL